MFHYLMNLPHRMRFEFFSCIESPLNMYICMQQELLNRTFMVMRRKKKFNEKLFQLQVFFLFDRAQLKIDVPVNSLSRIEKYSNF